MPLQMLPHLNSSEFFPPSNLLPELCEMKYEPKFDIKYETKYDPKQYEMKYDPKYEMKYDPGKFDNSKIPPLVPVALPPPVNGPFNFLPPISHMHHQDPLYPMPMQMYGALQMPALAPMSDDQHDPHNPHMQPGGMQHANSHMPPGMMDMRHGHLPPPQSIGSIFKPYQHMDLNMSLQSDEDEDVKPLI
jgi:hypothetical protein